MMKMKIEGADSVRRKLRSLSNDLEKLSGTHDVPIDEVLTSTFLKTHSRFSSIDELLEAGGFNVENQDDFENIPDEELDTFIRKETNFDNWSEMLNAAAVPWAKKQLGL